MYNYTQNTQIVQNELQNKRQTIHSWSSIWQMKISYSKCNILQIGPAQPPQSVHIKNIPISNVSSVVDLGVTVDSDLLFKIHISNIFS